MNPANEIAQAAREAGLSYWDYVRANKPVVNNCTIAVVSRDNEEEKN
jgi:hypothetical protein